MNCISQKCTSHEMVRDNYEMQTLCSITTDITVLKIISHYVIDLY